MERWSMDQSTIEIPEGFLPEEEAQPEAPAGFQPEESNLIDKANDAVNLGLTYMQGRTFGVGPKAMSAIGAIPAKGILETAEGISKIGELAGLNKAYEAPSYGDLYKMGVEGYQGKVSDAYQEHPFLAPAAEAVGGIRTAIKGSKTKYGKGIDNWANAPQSTGPLASRAAALFGRATRKALLGEAGYRTYKIGTAKPGEEMDEAISGVPMGGIVGGIASPVGDLIGVGVKSAAPKIEDAMKPVVELARKHKIPVSVDQVAPSKPLKNIQKISQELPFSGHDAFRDEQMQAFNKAIFKTFGQDADRFTQETMAKSFKQVGKQFDDFAKGKNFDINSLKGHLDEILDDEDAYSQEAMQAITKNIQSLAKEVDEAGSISGEKLAFHRTKVNRLARKANDYDKKILFSDLENAIIETISESDEAAKSGIKEAKKNYKNLLVVEPLAQKSKGGNISPSQLNTRVSRIYGRRHTVGESGDIGELAKVGMELLPEAGGSDTLQKGMYLGAATGAGFFEPMTVGTGLLANKGFQKWYNQNPKQIEKLLTDEYMKSLPLNSPLRIGTTTGAIESGSR
jgi:hypothetical protein